MATDDCQPTFNAAERPSRREVLGFAAAASIAVVTGASATPNAGATDATADTPTSGPATTQPSGKPWWLGDEHPRSIVVDARSRHVLNASVADRLALTELIILGVQSLTFTNDPASAWRAVLGPAKRIVLKFNAVAAPQINTTDAMARALVDALGAGGYAADTIAMVEAPDHLRAQLSTREAPRGWGPPISIGSAHDDLANYVYDADAIINVPFIKTHKIAGMTCCLKNLSHAVVRHPARYHANGCSPFVGQIVEADAITSKLKLNIVNAIRTVTNHGPDATERDMHAHGGILVGFDPVATDVIALDILMRQRRDLGMLGKLDTRYLEDAGNRGVGRKRLIGIDRVVVEVGS